jgi:hypothetical protein
MSFGDWRKRRREKAEARRRFNELKEEDIQILADVERKSYLKVAKNQAILRGKINAYKDFPIKDEDRVIMERENIKLEKEDDKEVVGHIEEVDEEERYG